MKRFHVHVAVDDLAANIRFYSAMFGAQPAVVKDDYAKWMLEDPRINFAISNRGAGQGLDHLGLQVDSDEELAALRQQVTQADIAAREQPAAACCYAKSNKYWVTDPQGLAWETYHTLASIPTFGADRAKTMDTRPSDTRPSDTRPSDTRPSDTGSAVASTCGTAASAKGGCGSAITDAKLRAACC